MIPNILVDSVVLPNKPLSNLEIIVAKKLSSIFYNSERVQQNGEVFCGHLCLFVLTQLSLGYNLQTVINSLI